MTLASRSDSFDGTITDNSSIDDCKDVTNYSLPLGHLNDIRLTKDEDTLVELFGRQNNGYAHTVITGSPNSKVGDEFYLNVQGREVNVNITHTSQGVPEDCEEKKVSTNPPKSAPSEKTSPSRVTILIRRHSKLISFSIGILLLLGIITFTILHFVTTSTYETTTSTPSTTTKHHIIHNLFTRENWGARDSGEKIPALITPVSLVIIKHTKTDMCTHVSDCFAEMKQLQNYDVGVEKLPDLRYNFVIGADWNVYEGRGWKEQNSQRNDSIDIAFMGNYNEVVPGEITVATGPWLIDIGVNSGYLDANVRVVCHNQTENTDSPGEYLYREVVKWKYYSNEIIGN